MTIRQSLNRTSLKAIQAFEVAARHSSIALAAEELFVTPSAVSHQIKLLEEEFGIQLFHRVHRAVVLTDAGRYFAEKISSAFNSIEMATRELGQTSKRDILTINSAPSFATQWLMPRMNRFSALNPDIDVRINTSYPVTDLTPESLDIDIRYGVKKINPVGTVVLPFPVENIVPLCAPEVLQRNGNINVPKDLSKHTLIHSELCLVGWADYKHQYPELSIDISRGHRFNRSFMAISAAVDGLGVCLESVLLVQRELKDKRLIAPLGLEGIEVKGYTLNIMKSKIDLPKIQSFQSWLFEQLE